QRRTARATAAGDPAPRRGPGAAGARPRLWPARGRRRAATGVCGVGRRGQAVPAIGACARDHGSGGRGYPAVPGDPHRGRSPALRGAHRHRPAVRRVRTGGRRDLPPPGGTGTGSYRPAPVPARADAQGSYRPMLGVSLEMDRGSVAPRTARERAARVQCWRLAAALALLWVPLAAAAKPPPQAQVRHPFLAMQPDDAPESTLLAVEIPAGSAIKYEISEEGLVYVDRFVSMPVAYPANYGSIPRSLAGDGDPLDALVLTRAPLHPGVLVRFRPVGVLRMRDGG